MTRTSLLLASGLVATSLTYPGAQPPPPAQPTFRTEANFVRVDVYPTRNGVPVEDLTAADFEILEDNALQKLETFEHVRVGAPGPQTTRIEPNTVRDANAMAADPRARVFVIFLDTYHVTVEGSHNIRDPLVRMLDRLIGQDDLVGVMTPEMSAANVTVGRKTGTIEGLLTRHWTWGRRESRADRDPEEEQYELCFPVPHPDPRCANAYKGVAEEMILRRREKRTIDALTDLAVHLRGVREERKAILTISNGWLGFKPNDALARMVPEQCGGRVPGAPEIGTGRDGRLSTANERNPMAAFQSKCERDRVLLAQLDTDRDYRDLLNVANRANVTFYPIDPRGLAVFDSGIDTGIGVGVPPPPAVDRARLAGRVDSLRTLAENTDGIAVVNSNDLDAGLNRIVADLTSYYLVGYYSTNPKLDGSYRRITVRVKRPGIEVRARRGYRAATAAEISAARTAAASTPSSATDSAIQGALSELSMIKRDARLRVHAAHGGDALWVVGELDPSYARDDWRNGGQVAISVINGAGAEAARATAAIAAKSRSFLARIDAKAMEPGAYTVRVRVSAPDAIAAMESARVEVGDRPHALGAPVLMRRGQFTTMPFEPAADRRFRRSETIRVQATAAAPGAARVRLLDRTGRPLGVPMAARETDADGAHWVVADLALAPLGAGEYLVEIESGGERVVTAFVVTN